MKHFTGMRSTKSIVVSAALLLLISPHACVHGASVRFDLTQKVGPNFEAFPEVTINLGVNFVRVDRAAIEINGLFTPGLVRPVTIPEGVGPVLASDTVEFVVRLGETGSSWIDKKAYAIQDLKGHSGSVSVALPLKGVAKTSSLVLMPSGEEAPNYDFLLDGRFGISTGTTHALAFIYQELEPPRFELTKFVLAVEGIAVPEPAGGSLLLLGVAWIAIGFRHCPTMRLSPRRYPLIGRAAALVQL